MFTFHNFLRCVSVTVCVYVIQTVYLWYFTFEWIEIQARRNKSRFTLHKTHDMNALPCMETKPHNHNNYNRFWSSQLQSAVLLLYLCLTTALSGPSIHTIKMRCCCCCSVLCVFSASFLLIPFLCCANAIAVFVCMLLDWLVFVLWSHCNIEESQSSVRINSLIPLKMHLVYIGSKQQQSLCMRMCMFFLVCWLMLECRSMHHGERREIQRFYDITSHRQ